MGNGVTTIDSIKAANDLLGRDHEKIIELLESYYEGQLGAYFVPPIFFSEVPEVIDPGEYDKKTDGKGKFKDIVRGQTAEHIMFNELKKHFEKSKDDVLVVHSHKFLDNDSNNEKDYIVVNLSKGYILVIEVKASASKYQKSKKQLADARTKIEEILHNLGKCFTYVTKTCANLTTYRELQWHHNF